MRWAPVYLSESFAEYFVRASDRQLVGRAVFLYTARIAAWESDSINNLEPANLSATTRATTFASKTLAFLSFPLTDASSLPFCQADTAQPASRRSLLDPSV